MPEIPELEGFKSYITAHCLNKPIADITSNAKNMIQKPSFEAFKKILIGNSFASAQRQGKYLLIKLKKTNDILVMHFALTGSLFYAKNSSVTVPFSHVEFEFKNGSVLHWMDKRKFAKLWIINDVHDIEGLGDLGPDALTYTKKQFLDLLDESPSQNIKSLLMDQSKIAGIGNEYADEILFQAGIDPHHTVKELTKAQREKIFLNLGKVLDYAIKVQVAYTKHATGPQFFTKEDRHDFKSSYLQAHRHVDMVCPKNKNHRLKKAAIAGRTTYYCPVDQT